MRAFSFGFWLKPDLISMAFKLIAGCVWKQTISWENVKVFATNSIQNNRRVAKPKINSYTLVQTTELAVYVLIIPFAHTTCLHSCHKSFNLGNTLVVAESGIVPNTHWIEENEKKKKKHVLLRFLRLALSYNEKIILVSEPLIPYGFQTLDSNNE